MVALDVPSARAASDLLNVLPETITWYKVGLELFIAEGPSVLRPLIRRGKRIFLDLKLLDIPKTVAGAVASATRHGVGLLTIHASGGGEMIRAACRALRPFGAGAPQLVAVTVLTSLNHEDLREMGIWRAPQQQALEWAALALKAGAHGLVCSPLEVGLLRRRLGPKPILVTPGIRPSGMPSGDQKRVATAREAVRAGADFVVVGRPVIESLDPAATALSLLAEIRQAYTERRAVGKGRKG